MSLKPRIKSLAMQGVRDPRELPWWICVGVGVCGYGATPRRAYLNWLAYLREFHNHGGWI